MSICNLPTPIPGGGKVRFILIALPRKGVFISPIHSGVSTLLFPPLPLPLLMPPPDFLSLNPSFLLPPSVNNTTDRVDTEVATLLQSKMRSFRIDLILVLKSFQKSTKLVYQRNSNRKLPSSMKRKENKKMGVFF